jgi:hypothetical protein
MGLVYRWVVVLGVSGDMWMWGVEVRGVIRWMWDVDMETKSIKWCLYWMVLLVWTDGLDWNGLVGLCFLYSFEERKICIHLDERLIA